MPASTVTPDEHRLLPLAGGHNFRDLGGYETADGQRVRRHVLYRSGKLSGLTSQDVALLASKNIRVVCDLRTPVEREKEPSVTGFSAWHRSWDYDAGHSRLRQVAAAREATPQDVHDALAATYRKMPWHFAGPYGCVINHIVSGDVPLVFHCMAGKDRTGLLAALILRVLGVPEATVLADYLLTDRCLDIDALVATPRAAGSDAAAAGFAYLQAMPPNLRAPLLKCHPAYLEGALRAVEARHGSVLGYMHEALGVGGDGMAALRHRLLEPAGQEAGPGRRA